MEYKKSNRKVLFVSVHPDDETFGCGGTILKHRHMGDRIFWLNLTARIPGHPGGFSEVTFNKRNDLINTISAQYGFEKSFNIKLQTGLLDTYSMFEIVGKIDGIISEIEPDWIFIPNRTDVHSDHRVAFQAVYSCTKNFRKPYIAKILMYETLSETEFAPPLAENVFSPNYFVDVSAFMNRKIEIMNLYETEVMPDPMPRSIYATKGLASYRGSRIGTEYAEAFVLLFSRN